VERWSDGVLEEWGAGVLERKNKNRGYKRLRVWEDAVALYVETCQVSCNWSNLLNENATQAPGSNP
jgi:hypothetical protein